MTYQPPGGSPPEPTPYAQPQDPWAGGHEPGVVAAPTDPIPQQHPFAAGGYTPGVASPSVWTQETMSQGGPYGYVPAPAQPNRVGIYIVVALAIIVLGGGGGYGAYYVIAHRNTGNDPTGLGNSTTSNPTTSTSSAPAPATSLDAASVKLNDCLFNFGTVDEPEMQKVACSKPKSYKVVKIASGVGIPEGANGKFDRNTTAATVCGNIDYQAWYGWDSSDDTKDFFFCLTNNP